MPVQLHGSEYYDAITDDVVASWGVDQDYVFYGQPTASSPHHYAVIALGSVPMEFVGARVIEQTYEFQVVYWAPFGTEEGWNVELAKEERANALLAQLGEGALYAGTGLMPIVTSVTFDGSDDEEQDWFMVAVAFQVKRHERT